MKNYQKMVTILLTAAVLLTAICSESSGPRQAQGNFAVRATTPFPSAELPPSAKGAHSPLKLLAGSYLQCQTAFCSKSPRQRPLVNDLRNYYTI